MQLTVIIPSWMVSDGEYTGLGVGDRVRLGFTLEAGSVVRRSTSPGIAQAGQWTVLTSLAGRLSRPDDDAAGTAPTMVRGGGLTVLVPAADDVPDGTDVVATGFLTVEPYLWAEGSVSYDRAPGGVARWQVTGVRERNGGAPRDLGRLPESLDTDPGVAYLVDVLGPV